MTVTTPTQSGSKTNPSDLHSFTLDFFRYFGADIQPLAQQRSAICQVHLPPELADHFGKAALQLCFQNAEVTDDRDLVAYGSRIFDRMMAYLDRQGAVTVQDLPSRHSGAEELLQALQPTNAAISALQMAEQAQRLLIFNWHITYRADDKREELYHVVLDESGQHMPQPGDGGGLAPALDIEALLADARPPVPRLDGAGQPLPPQLPPLTRLAELAQTARRYALYHADLRCVDHERETLPRLHKVLSRLTTYYEEQIQELYSAHDPLGEKRRGLEEDLERKIAEEVENHRLRVQVRLFSYAILQIPIAVADITLQNGRHELPVRVWRNRYDGTIHRPRCTICEQETGQVTIDRNGHLICDGCIAQCQQCQEILCTGCGVEPCPVCQQVSCAQCGHFCWACGGRACDEHIDSCPICQDQVCHNCQTTCQQCSQRQCRSHLRADVVDEALICAACAVRCSGCHQYSARVGLCTASGQRFCANCLITCAGCGQQFGTGYIHLDATAKLPFCQSCLVPCSNCGSLTRCERACAVCGQRCCGHCGYQCAACRAAICGPHARLVPDCGHATCPTHSALCGVGQEPICPLCTAVCAICEQPHCQEHSAVCTMCMQAYCAQCVTEPCLCQTCTGLERNGLPLDLARQPIAADPKVAPLLKHYRWVQAGNRRYTLYLGRGGIGLMVLIVVRGKQLLTIRRLNLLDRIWGKGWS